MPHSEILQVSCDAYCSNLSIREELEAILESTNMEWIGGEFP